MGIVLVDVFGSGLGNLLFMHHVGYAHCKRLAQQANTDIGADNQLWMQSEYHDPKRPNISVYADLFRHVRLVNQADKAALYQQGNTLYYHEPCFPYLPIPVASNIVLEGYFQSYKYFIEYRHEIRDLLWGNVSTLMQVVICEYESISKNSETGLPCMPTVCMHVRRGDYLNLPQYHPTQPDSYYLDALRHIEARVGTVQVLLFSDDTPYAKEWSKKTLGNRSVYIDDTHPDTGALSCLMLMSLCDHFIIANSSLSLNAYYLRANEDALLCAPANWFGPLGPRFNIHDIVPPSALVL